MMLLLLLLAMVGVSITALPLPVPSISSSIPALSPLPSITPLSPLSVSPSVSVSAASLAPVSPLLPTLGRNALRLRGIAIASSEQMGDRLDQGCDLACTGRCSGLALIEVGMRQSRGRRNAVLHMLLLLLLLLLLLCHVSLLHVDKTEHLLRVESS